GPGRAAPGRAAGLARRHRRRRAACAHPARLAERAQRPRRNRASPGARAARAASRAAFGLTSRMRHVVLGLLALLAALGAQAATARSGIGINLGPVAYWQSDWPFIDEMKRAGGWYTRCEPSQTPQCRDFAPGASNADTKEQDKLDLDEHGWVKR